MSFVKHSNLHPLGFTLIEVMIAVAILAGMSLALFGASSQMINSKVLVEDRDDAQHSVSFALNRMSEDLNMAYFVKSRALLGTAFEGEISFLGKEDRIDFVSFSHLRFLKNAKESDSAEISYYLEADPDDPDSKILMRRESTTIDRNLEEGGMAYQVLKGVRFLEFRYLPAGKDPTKDEWKSVWDTGSSEANNRLPDAVKIRLEVVLPEDEEARTYTTLAPIQLTRPLAF